MIGRRKSEPVPAWTELNELCLDDELPFAEGLPANALVPATGVRLTIVAPQRTIGLRPAMARFDVERPRREVRVLFEHELLDASYARSEGGGARGESPHPPGARRCVLHR